MSGSGLGLTLAGAGAFAAVAAFLLMSHWVANDWLARLAKVANSDI